nr:hypothetical protein [Cupriavidus sp. UYPR2.512]
MLILNPNKAKCFHNHKAYDSNSALSWSEPWITKYLLEREHMLATAKPAVLAMEEDGNSPGVLANSVDVSRIPAVQATTCDVAPSAFVRVVQVPAKLPAPIDKPVSPAMELALHVRLPNGVELDLGKAHIDELTAVVQILGRLPCSGSTKN